MQDVKIILRLESMVDHNQERRDSDLIFHEQLARLLLSNEPYIPNDFRQQQRPTHDNVRTDLEWQSWDCKTTGRRPLPRTSHKNDKGKNSKGGEIGTSKCSFF